MNTTGLQDNTSGPAPNGVAKESWSSLGQVLWHKKKVVGLCLVICLAVGATYVYLATPVYTSTARIYVESNQAKAGDRSPLVARNYVQTQCEMIRTTPVLQEAIRLSGNRANGTLAGQADPVGWLKQTVKIEAGKKDDIISLSLESPYPAQANVLVDAIAEAFIRSGFDDGRSSTTEILKNLRIEKAKRQGEMAANFEAMQTFKQAHGLLSIDGGKGGALSRKMEDLSAAMIAAELDTIVAKADYEAAAALKNDVGAIRYVAGNMARGNMVRPDQEEAQLAAEISQMQGQLTTLRRQCSEEHPAVQALKTRIEQALRSQAEGDRKFAERHLMLCSGRLATAQQKTTEIKAALVAEQAQAQKVDAQSARCEQLESEYKRSARINELLDSRIDEMAMASTAGPAIVRVVEQAVASTDPTSPNKAKIGLLASALGIMSGVMLSILLCRLDRRIHFAAEVSTSLRLPLLGAVPACGRRRTSGPQVPVMLVEAASPAAEAYRDIRTAVQFGAREERIKTLLITSANAQEGKSTLVSNLGIGLAQAGQRTLIIDADLRSPVQHEVFNLSIEPGLAEVLEGQASLKEAVRRTCVDRLDILTSGNCSQGAAELLQSKAFGGMIEELSARYDRIIIDSPPLMSVTDSRILGATCDATVLVLRAEQSMCSDTQHALDDLLDVGAKVLGAVLTDVPQGTNRYRQYGRYGYPKKTKVA